MMMKVTVRTAAPSGGLTKKIHRQLKAVTSKPPRGGSAMVARPATAPQMPSAAPRCSGGKTMVRIASVCGISIAASKPWTARKPISQPSAGAKPRAADAAVLTAISTTNMVRGPTGSPKSPRRDHQDSQRTSAYALSTQSTSSRDAPEPAARTSTPRNRILSGALGGGQLDHRSRSNVPLVILLRATL